MSAREPTIIIRNLSDRIFDIVRDQIVVGKLPVDQPIRQDSLAADLGVSKIPLREALGRLEHDGLLVSHPNRGFFVRPMSTDEAEEIFALRLAIEPEAMAAASRIATEADHDAAREALATLDEAASQHLEEVAARNRDFHMALILPARQSLTAQLVERLQTLGERYVHKHLEPAGREHRAHLEHQGLLDAWVARDLKRAKSLSSAHIQGTLEDLRSQIA